MAKWDGGKYGEVLLDGDIHTENQKAAGLQTRPQAKTFIYAFLYGAGDAKIGSIVGGDAGAGRKLKQKFLRSLPALGRLVEAVQGAAKRGYLVGLDGRFIHVRSSHAALNTLLQGAGAVICKTWITYVEQMMVDRGYRHGWDGDFAFCAFSHDEIQVAVRNEPELVEEYRQITADAMTRVAETYQFRCPLATESKVGKDWSETH
jgi:DNA polymerase I-like protein with 3'-5' exonuclease and polymerase domains